MKLDFSRQTFEKSSNIKCLKIRPVGAEFYADRQKADGHDEINSRFPQVCVRA